MGKPDMPGGAEAFSKLPFKDVVVKLPEARRRLHDHSFSVLHDNMTEITAWASGLPPKLQPVFTLQLFQTEREQPGFLVPKAGLYVDPVKLERLYDPLGPKTFGRAVREVFQELEAKLDDPELRTRRLPGVEAMCHFLDLIHILNGDFDQGVAMVLNEYHQDDTSADDFMLAQSLGWILDDTLQMRTGDPFDRDYLADREGAANFLATALRIGTPIQQTGLQQGMLLATSKAGERLREATRPLN